MKADTRGDGEDSVAVMMRSVWADAIQMCARGWNHGRLFAGPVMAMYPASLHLGGGMIVRASFASVLSGLLVSATSAQQPETAKPVVKFPPCAQSMIVGTWEAVFTSVAPLTFRVFACPIGIGATGTLAAGNCTTPDTAMTVTPPTGTLTIDRACHVTGTISYVVTERPSSYSSYTAQISVSLWRSIDGSKLSGSQRWTVRGSSYVFPFELIAGQ